MKRIVQRISALVLGSLLFIPNGATAGECLREERRLQTGSHGSTSLRSYLCRSSNSAASLNVTFLRLTDHVASALMEGRPPRMFQSIFAGGRLVYTPTFAELNTLLSRYGRRSQHLDQNSCRRMSIRPAGRGARRLKRQSCENTSYDFVPGTSLRSLGGWDYQEGTDVPALDLVNGIAEGGVRWRYMNRRDITNYSRNLRRYNRIAGETRAANVPRYIRMLEYISRQGLPEDFHFIVGQYETGGCFNNGRLALIYERPLRVYAAVIENTGRRAVTINRFFGISASFQGLRKPMWAKDVRGRSTTTLNIDGQRLAPGEKIILFRRLVFGTNKFLKDHTNNLRPKPRLKAYAYGPEFHLAGFTTANERFSLNRAANNFLNLSMSSGGGSCPYVEAWSNSDQDWVNHGKVLHHAHGIAKKEQDQITIPGLRLRYRLHERESELAYIDKVALDLALKGGSVVRLEPPQPQLKRIDGKDVRLYFGDRALLEFTLPAWIKPDDVVSSTLQVVGYYERYSTIFARRRLHSHALIGARRPEGDRRSCRPKVVRHVALR